MADDGRYALWVAFDDILGDLLGGGHGH